MRHLPLPAALAVLALGACSGHPDADVPGPLRDLADAAGYRIVSASSYRSGSGETSARGLVLARDGAGPGAPERIRVSDAHATVGADGVRVELRGLVATGGDALDITVEGGPGVPFRSLSLRGHAGGVPSSMRIDGADWSRGVLRSASFAFVLPTGSPDRHLSRAMLAGSLSYEPETRRLAARHLVGAIGAARLEGDASLREAPPKAVAGLAYAALSRPSDALRAAAALGTTDADVRAWVPAQAAPGAPWDAPARSGLLARVMDGPQGPARATAANAVAAALAGKGGIRVRLASDRPLPVTPEGSPAAYQGSSLVVEALPPRPVPAAARSTAAPRASGARGGDGR